MEGRSGSVPDLRLGFPISLQARPPKKEKRRYTAVQCVMCSVERTWNLSWPRSLEMKMKAAVKVSPLGFLPASHTGYSAKCRLLGPMKADVLASSRMIYGGRS